MVRTQGNRRGDKKGEGKEVHTDQTESPQQRQALHVGQTQFQQADGNNGALKGVPAHLRLDRTSPWQQLMLWCDWRSRSNSHLKVATRVHGHDFDHHLNRVDKGEDLRESRENEGHERLLNGSLRNFPSHPPNERLPGSAQIPSSLENAP